MARGWSEPRPKAVVLLGMVLASTLLVGGGRAVASTLPSTPHLDQVVAAISNMEVATGSDSTQGVLWSVTDGNTLPGLGTKDPAWLIRTQSCWGAQGPCSSKGVQRHLLATIRNIVASGTKVVDISSLTKLPYRDFRQAIIQGAAKGAAEGHAPIIRLLWGRTPITLATDGLSVDKNLATLRDQVQAAAPHATVVAALQSYTPVVNGYSWNHSKIVAADGRVALVMGINLWEHSYLQSSNPVTDVGVEVQGPAAASAERFLDVIWTSVCQHPGKSLAYWNTVIGASGPSGCPASFPRSVVGTGNVRVLSLGRSGYISEGLTSGRTPWFQPSLADRYDSRCVVPPIPNTMNGDSTWDGRNPSDTALRALVASATKKIVIAQQEMTFPCATSASYDLRLFDAIAQKVAAGVKVDIITSNPKSNINATEDYLANPEATKKILMRRLTKIVGSPEKARADACRSLMISPFRYTTASTWPDGKPPALHGKVIAVDDAAFYVGSQNAYPNQLEEFGYIIENHAAMGDLNRLYLDPLVKYSSLAALPCG
jgi:PLD-like domain